MSCCTTTGIPSWGYSIKHGATTIWERWDGWTEENGFGPVAMNSFNHYSPRLGRRMAVRRRRRHQPVPGLDRVPAPGDPPAPGRPADVGPGLLRHTHRPSLNPLGAGRRRNPARRRGATGSRGHRSCPDDRRRVGPRVGSPAKPSSLSWNRRTTRSCSRCHRAGTASRPASEHPWPPALTPRMWHLCPMCGRTERGRPVCKLDRRYRSGGAGPARHSRLAPAGSAEARRTPPVDLAHPSHRPHPRAVPCPRSQLPVRSRGDPTAPHWLRVLAVPGQ